VSVGLTRSTVRQSVEADAHLGVEGGAWQQPGGERARERRVGETGGGRARCSASFSMIVLISVEGSIADDAPVKVNVCCKECRTPTSDAAWQHEMHPT
jgi:hypothetical protein